MGYNIGMLFRELAVYFQQIEETSLRNQKTAILAELFGKLSSEEVAKVVYLSVGRVGPLYDPLEFGLAAKMMIRAIAWGTGKTTEEVMAAYKKIGDLGTLVEQLRSKELNDQLTQEAKQIISIYDELLKIAQDSGKGSQDRKTERLGRLIKEEQGMSAKYIVRLVMGKLRLGFSDLTILDALSWAQTGSKVDRGVLEAAFNVWNDMGEVARVYKDKGVTGLSELDVVPGRPVKPMRAERLGTITEILAKLQTFAVEPKFDGFRVQVHAFMHDGAEKDNEQQQVDLFGSEEREQVKVKIFSRGLENITHQFPEIVVSARELYAQTGPFVIDGEAIGVKPDGTFLPFQETIKRKRKYDVETTAASVPLRMYVFDVLYGEGQGQLGKPYAERRALLAKMLAKVHGVFELTESTTVTTVTQAKELFEGYMQRGLEGMLCKRIDSHYLAGARNFNWVKYKRAHESDLADTIDGVVIGGYAGKGKRQQFGVGAFLIGVQGEDGQLMTVAKIGTGLTDEQFRELYTKLTKYQTTKEAKDARYQVPKSLEPDVWVAPKIIVEIEADEITQSPLHSSGYALRFPRLLRFREDKGLSDITTTDEVARLFTLFRNHG